MNKKQLICMWCGIVVFVFVGLITAAAGSDRWTYLWRYYAPLLIVYWPSVAIVTGGLIYTLRDKQGKKDKDG
jgi:hypothetical protein